MKRKYFLFIITASLLLNTSFLFSQGEGDGNHFNSYYTDPFAFSIPPTPNAASFAKYGGVPVNTSTGLPNISIPIFTIEEDGVQVPISLSYNASGIMVDEHSSTVGMKWSLNAGGGIFRTIKDIDDFTPIYGWLNNNNHYENWLDSHSNWDYTSADKQQQLSDLINNHDNWPDNFNYNFLNFSGDFMYKPNGTIVRGIKDQLQIVSSSDNGFDFNDVYGNSYEFNEKEKNETYTYIYEDNQELLSIEREDNVTVSWFLSEITTKNGKTIEFEYEPYNDFSYTIQPASQRLVTVSYCDPCIEYPEGCEGSGSTSYQHEILKETRVDHNTDNKLIKKITTTNTDVEFEYVDGSVAGQSISGWDKRLSKIIIKDKIENKQKEFHFVYGYFNGSEKRLKLKEVYEVGFDNSQKPSYKFEYNNLQLPERGSYAKDYKGFYNGRNTNTSYLPKTAVTLNRKRSHGSGWVYPGYELLSDRYYDEYYLKAGVLTKIEYPTGGSTEFTYEANAFGENQDEPIIENKGTTISTNTGFYNYSENNHQIFNVLVEFKKAVGKIELVSTADCPFCDAEQGVLEFPKIAIHEYLGEDINDSFTHEDIGDEVLHTSLWEHNSLYFPAIEEDGIYVVQLKVHNSTYPIFEGDSIFVNVDLYWHQKKTDINDNVQFQKNYFGGLRIKETIDYTEEGYPAGKKSYQYKSAETEDDYNSGYYNLMLLNSQNILSSEKMERDYTPQVTGYTYTEVEIKNRYVLVVPPTSSEPSIGKIVEYYDSNRVFNSIKGGNLTKRIIMDGDDNILQLTEKAYDTQHEDSFNFETPPKMDFSYTVYVSCFPYPVPKPVAGYSSYPPTYTYNEKRNVLVSDKTTQFYKKGSSYYPVTTIKEMDYNDNVLVDYEKTDTRYTGTLQLGTSMNYALDNPNGEYIEVEYTYPTDHSSEMTGVPIGLPATKKIFNSGSLIMGQAFEYDTNGNIKKAFHYNKGQGSNSSSLSYIPSNYEEVTSYIYQNGNPVQVRNKDGQPVSYIWGYNNRYPVAKIENATYAQATNTSGLNMSVINNPSSDDDLRDEIDKIRQDLPQAMVTTYTYKPLVGMTSQTDTKGDTTTYHYDDLGRLEFIMDTKGRIVEEYKYHYKNEN